MKKGPRYLTLIVVPHHKEGQHSFHFSYALLRWLAAGVGVLVLAIAALIVSYGKIYWRAGQYELMRKRHDQMEAEFSKLQQIKAELARLRSEEAKVRQMLGVPKQPDTLSTAQVSSSASARETPAPPPENNDRLVPSLMPTRGWVSAGISPQHRGVDIAARQGQPIMAAADGVVDSVDWDGYYGNKLSLRHGDRYVTFYGHCDKVLVQQMQPVRRGQVIALVGSSGKSTGPHLHYEIHQDGKVVDPQSYWFNR